MGLEFKDIRAGDILRMRNGTDEYVFRDEDGVLYLNACNEGWIARGLRGYGEEGYPLSDDDIRGAEIVGHYGDGWFGDGWRWYAESGREDKWRTANGYEPRPERV